MNKNLNEFNKWLKQAIADLNAAKANKKEFPYNSCFLSQQSAEKALKAFLYLKGKRDLITHSIVLLIQVCSEYNKDFLDFKKDAKRLDSNYLATRYPDALPDQTPVDFYDLEDAEESINSAEKILNKVLEEKEKIDKA
ncbi:MAG: HEPN domain-containing protein [Candidatus Woesearchaeota archaeon]